MKKLIVVCITAIMAASIMTGCSGIKEVFSKANGVILYGEQKQIEGVFNQEKKEVKEKAEYKVKVAEAGKQKVLILDKTTAKALVGNGLFKEVTKDGKTDTITILPEVKKGNAALFAKQNVNQLNLGGKKIKVSYEGNKIIGDGRSYVDMFLIVDDSEWSAMKGAEKEMGIIKYKNDPKKKIANFDVEAVQLVKIEK